MSSAAQPARQRQAELHPERAPSAGPRGPGGRMRGRLAARLPKDAERGSAAVIVVMFALTLLVLAGFVVDGGLAISNRERAQDIAEQAARYAAQNLDEDALREGGAAPIDFSTCQARTAEYVATIQLTSASIVGTPTCSPIAANRVAVEVTVRYQPIFSSFFRSSFEVSGRAEAEAQTG